MRELKTHKLTNMHSPELNGSKSYMYREVLRIRECKMYSKHENCLKRLQKANIYCTHKHRNVGWLRFPPRLAANWACGHL